MTLTKNQQKVLNNTLAWCSKSFIPTEAAINDFFALTDQGVKITSASALGTVELYQGYCAHYSDEFGWISSYERRVNGELGNPPEAPPAAWIYHAYWTDPAKGWTGWVGWLSILIECFKDWPRSQQVFERAYVLAAYHHEERYIVLNNFRGTKGPTPNLRWLRQQLSLQKT